MDINHGKYLGVDYGDKRTGLAECDISGMLASGICTILASYCLTLAIRHIGSVYTSILGSIELIVCAVAGYFILDESLSWGSKIGIVVIMIATILVAISKKEKKG